MNYQSMTWDDYHMNIATAVAAKSKDPSTQVGCVIVGPDNRIISQGFNGHISGAHEGVLSWERPDKYMTVIHAEMNALIFARRDLSGCKAYVTDAPCESCLKHLLQAGIREIYYETAQVMRLRGTEEQKKAVLQLISATKAEVICLPTGALYENELYYETAEEAL